MSAGLLGLGSNVGERRIHLQAAVDALAAAGAVVLAASSVYDTDPVGEVPDQPSFLNACLRIETALEPLELLDAVKRLERELGRADAEVRHGPRTIDIDILLLGGLELRHERMSLPHGQLLNRRFVLIPAVELDFDSARQMARAWRMRSRRCHSMRVCAGPAHPSGCRIAELPLDCSARLVRASRASGVPRRQNGSSQEATEPRLCPAGQAQQRGAVNAASGHHAQTSVA